MDRRTTMEEWALKKGDFRNISSAFQRIVDRFVHKKLLENKGRKSPNKILTSQMSIELFEKSK